MLSLVNVHADWLNEIYETDLQQPKKSNNILIVHTKMSKENAIKKKVCVHYSKKRNKYRNFKVQEAYL